MRLIAAFAVACLAVVASGARAGGPVLVELFTSQGCSSCPPADKLLGRLAASEGVVALGFHVDYWDYLGWRDTFAHDAFTARQAAYSRVVDRSGIHGQALRGKFTPEMVVQGQTSLIGSDKGSVIAAVNTHAMAPDGADVTLRRDGGDLLVVVAPGPAAQSATVKLARISSQETVAIARGENAKRTLTYHNVVRELRSLADWDGRSSTRLRVPGIEGPAVVFVQVGRVGPVLGVASID